MAISIMKGFYTFGWVGEDPSNEGKWREVSKVGIGYDEMSNLYEIVFGTLYTIAFCKDIFEDDEDIPTIGDYDIWKQELYDWADYNRVWIEPAPIV